MKAKPNAFLIDVYETKRCKQHHNGVCFVVRDKSAFPWCEKYIVLNLKEKLQVKVLNKLLDSKA
jgi:hypothetical protein